jgi:hypothetical protein
MLANLETVKEYLGGSVDDTDQYEPTAGATKEDFP